MANSFVRSQERAGRVPLRIKFYQGLGALPGQHKDWAFSTLLVLYYSQVLGLPATYASIALAISLVVDAISDPLVGAFSDNFRSRLGRRHPLMFTAIIPTGLCVYALFAPPQTASETVLVAWLLVFTVLTRTVFSFFAVPWNAVAAELSQDYTERTTIITFRMAVGWIGGVLFIFLVYTFIFPSSDAQDNGLLQADRYPVFALVVAALIITWMSLTTFLTRSQVVYLPQPTDSVPRTSLPDMISRTGLALRNRNFRVLFVAILFSSLVFGTGQVFDVYMNLYFWDFKTEQLRWFSFAVAGAIASFALAPVLQRYWEKQQVMLGSLFVFSILAMIKVGFRYWNIWPDNGDPLLLWIFVFFTTFQAFFASLVLIMFASMMADIADEQELETGLRQEGVFSAGISFAAKTTTGLGLVTGGLLLDHFIGFPRGTVPGEVESTVLWRLAFVDAIAVPAFNAIPCVLLLRYSLKKTRVIAIQNEIRARQH